MAFHELSISNEELKAREPWREMYEQDCETVDVLARILPSIGSIRANLAKDQRQLASDSRVARATIRAAFENNPFNQIH